MSSHAVRVPPDPPPPDRAPSVAAPRWSGAAAVWAVALATVGALALGAPALALVPALAAAGVLVLLRVPLRWPALALVLAALGADDSQSAEGLWSSPLAPLGDLLLSDVPLLKLSVLEAALLALAGIAVWRRLTGAPADAEGRVPAAGAARDVVLVSLAAAAFATAVGLLTGGEPGVALFQVRPFLAVALLYFVLDAALRGSRDGVAIRRVILLAALSKAAIAIWVRVRVAPWVTDREVEYTTSHGDSVLFVAATVMLVAHFLERRDLRRLADLALGVPVLLWAMDANARRIAWVELALALAVLALLLPWSRWKQTAARVGLLALPGVLLYVALGWGSGHPLFAPVEGLRGLTDTTLDRSTWNRHVENWNVAVSTYERPVLGLGFGHAYTEYIVGDDISSKFELYRNAPHNMTLGLLLFGGLLGFFGLWLPYVVGIYLAARAYRHARTPEHRAAALTAIGAIVAVCVQNHGDMGVFLTQSKIFTALALVLAGKLAVETGAWPRRAARARRSTAPLAPSPRRERAAFERSGPVPSDRT